MSGPPPGGRRPPPGAPPSKIDPDRKYHVLEAIGAQPLYLRPGENFTIGRDRQCELTVPSKRVSREHAQIFWRAGLPVIRNMSDNNKTLVNGSAVEEAELRHRDEIQVGPYKCTYTFAKGGAVGVGKADLNQATMVAEEGAAMRGSLDVQPIGELLRDMERHKKTGTLQIRSDAGDEGVIVLDKGSFYSVTLGSERGESALRKLVQLQTGTYVFSLEKKTAPLKLIRKFDYSAAAPEDLNIEIKSVKIGDYLDWVEGGCRGAPRTRGGRGGRSSGGGMGGMGRGGGMGGGGGGGGGVPGRGW